MAGKWKHGWVPLDMAAAMSKAHGSKKGASSALSSAHVVRVGPNGGLIARTTGAKGSSRGVGNPIAPGLSKGYIADRGATKADVAQLSRNFQVMHGRKPTSSELAKIKKR